VAELSKAMERQWLDRKVSALVIHYLFSTVIDKTMLNYVHRDMTSVFC
jgi:hypothetical protein